MSHFTLAPPKPSAALPFPRRRAAFKIALAYAAIGVTWILGSDWLMHRLLSTEFHRVGSWLKGWLFVAVTALLLAWALDRYFALIRRSARQLKETEERWKRALEGASQAVWDWNVQSGTVIYSLDWAAMLGYDPQDIGDAISEWESRIHPDDLPRVMADLQAHLNGQSPAYESEHRLRCKDGSFKWILDRGRVTRRSAEGKPLRLVGTHSDIHRRKLAEERNQLQHDLVLALAAANRLDDGLQLCLEAAVRADGLTCGGFYLSDTQDGTLHLRVHSGFSPEFTLDIARIAAESPQGRLVAAGKPVYAEYAELKLNQSEVEAREGLQSIAILPVLHQGQVLGCLSIASHTHSEISEPARMALETIAASAGEVIARLHAQEAMRENEARYRALFDGAAEGILLLSPDGKMIKVNASFARIHGYDTPEEMNSVPLSALDTPFCAPFAEERIRWVAAGKHLTFEVEHYRKDGSTIPLSANASRVEVGGTCYLQVFYRDISEQKRTEEASRHRLDLQDQLAKVAGTVPGLICSFRLRPDGSACMPFATPALKELYDLHPEEVRDDFSPILARVHPDDRQQLQQGIAESARTMQPWHGVFRACHPQKGELWIEGNSMPRLEPDGSILWHGFVQDVTERRRSEIALQESERQLTTLLSNLPGMAYRCLNAPEWPMVFVSEGCNSLTGYSAPEFLNNKPAYGHTILAEDRQSVWDNIQRAIEERCSFELLYRIMAANGQIKWVWERGQGIFDDTGQLLFLEGFTTDISDLKRLEQERESALIKYRTLFDAFPLGITVTDPQGRIIESNRQAESILGLDASLARKRRITGAEWSIVRPDGTPMPAEEFASVRALRDQCLVENVEMGLVKSPTETTWISVTAAPVPLPEVGVVITYSDITKRWQADEALRASELKYRVVADNTFDWEFWLNTEGRFVYNSPSCERITGRKRAEFEADPTLMLRIIHPDDRARFQAHRHATRQKDHAAELEFRVIRPDGEVRWIAHVCSAIQDDAGAHLGVRGSNHDITGRKESEAALATEALLRRLLVEGSRDGIVVLDQEGGVFEANQRFATMLRYTPDEIRQLHVWDWDRDWPRERVLAAIRALGPEGAHFETRHWRKDGSVFHVEMSNSTAELHGEKLVFCVCHDITERKQAEEALRQSLLFRREAERIGRIGAWKVSPETDYLYWTEGVHAILDVPTDYQPGLNEGLRFYDAESIPALQTALGTALAEGTPFSLEAGLTTATGQHLWVEVRGLGRVEEGGQSYVMGTFQDITERKRAEARITRENLRTRFLLEFHQRAPQMTDRELYDHVLERAVLLTGSTIGFFHQISEDQNTIILTTWNAETLKHCAAAFDTHYPLKEAGNWVDCVRQQRPIIYNDYAHSPNQHGLPEGHTHVERFMSIPVVHDGKVRIIFGVGNKASDYDPEDVEQLQVVANELHKIMAQRAAQGQLRQLSSVVEQSPVSVVITDTHGNIEYVNPKFTQVSGYTLDEVRGKNPRVLKSGDMSAAQYRDLWQTILDGRIWQGEFHNRRKNGELHWESASISPITNPTGEQITHFVAIKEDITERKHLESQLRQAQKLEGIGQLAGGVAHDFNNILAAIMMHLGLLQMNPALDQDTLQSLKDLDSEARRAAALTRQLLMFSRRSVLAIKPQDLNEIVANVLKMLTRLIGENINLNFEGCSRLPLVEADAGMMEQVLMNLVVNARDAMPKGGRITITTSTVELHPAEAALNPDSRTGRFVCLSVSDTGTGMDEQTLKRIFEPFFTTKEAGKGTGLGLATVHGIVAQHRGWVEVTSRIGQGTAFRVFLAAQEKLKAETPQAQPSAPLERGRETILLVEDNDRVRRTVGQTMRALGYQVHEAGNGQEAMTLWQKHGAEVDLLFTDMVMPEGMTGLELTERLQSLKPSLKVIISSGYSAEIAQAGVPDKAGVVYLPKPYEARTLADAVRNCLRST